jgi:hypothetical protein
MYIREGLLQDLPYIADIGSEALIEDEITEYLAPYRKAYPLCHRDENLYRMRKRFFAGDELIVVATDQGDKTWTGKDEIVGFAFWSTNLPDVPTRRLPTSFLGNGELGGR